MNRVAKRASQIVPGDLVVERDGPSSLGSRRRAAHLGRLALSFENVNGYMVAPTETIVDVDDLIACLVPAAEEV